MNGHDPQEEGNGTAEEIDTGEPIEMLRDFAEEPTPGFLGRIRRAIQRRALVSQVADLSWTGPVLVLLEYLQLLFGLFGDRKRREEDRE